MRIGLLFGTFDPPHSAHVNVAEHMLRTQGLHEVWLVVTPLNPFKQHQAISPNHHRVAMAQLAIEGRAGLAVSDFELGLPTPSYTVDTLQAMRERWPEHRFVLIVGSDNLASLNRWKNPEGILAHHDLLVYPRPGADLHQSMSAFQGHPRITALHDAPVMDTSSTRLREELAAGRFPTDALALSVLDYIREHRLYQS
jgi:nicotinate-nucleotide adenylyltransferase